MAQQLSPQIQAVLRILEQRMDPPAASFDQRFNAAIPSFDERFRTFEGDQATVMPHEIEYGMSQRPYDRELVNSLMPSIATEPPKVPKVAEPAPLDPKQFPGMEDFLQPGTDNSMEDMASMFFGG